MRGCYSPTFAIVPIITSCLKRKPWGSRGQPMGKILTKFDVTLQETRQSRRIYVLFIDEKNQNIPDSIHAVS